MDNTRIKGIESAERPLTLTAPSSISGIFGVLFGEVYQKQSPFLRKVPGYQPLLLEQGVRTLSGNLKTQRKSQRRR